MKYFIRYDAEKHIGSEKHTVAIKINRVSGATFTRGDGSTVDWPDVRKVYEMSYREVDIEDYKAMIDSVRQEQTEQHERK